MGSIYKGSTKVNKLYVGSKAIQKVYKGSTLIWSGGANSAGTATITYSNATGTGISITMGIYGFHYLTEFSNNNSTYTASWSSNDEEELNILPWLTSGYININMTASGGFNAVTTLNLGGTIRNGYGAVFVTLPAMPNLKAVTLGSGWAGYSEVCSTSADTLSIIQKLRPNSIYISSTRLQLR